MHLRGGKMKPPNTNISTKIKVPIVVATTMDRKITAIKRHMDVDARCRANSTRSWQKNLKTIW